LTPLFPPWGNSLFRFSLTMAAAGLVGVPTFFMLWVRTPYATGQQEPRVQPVKFDHRHHVRDEGIECTYCHFEALRSAFAGVPPTSLCMGCHAQIWTRSPELAAVRASWIEDRPIAWRRVNALPQHVYFDHAIHVKKGVGCVTCHGRVDEMAQVLQVEELSMSWCLDCHRDPERYVRPPEKVTDMEWVPDRPQREVGAEIVSRLAVRPMTDCVGCHR
jgi:Cytochrome c7 and related cytochrome c